MVDVALVELEGVVFETRELRHASLCEAFAAQGVDAPVEIGTISGLTPRASVVAALAAAQVSVDDVLIDLVTLDAERAFSTRLAMGGVFVSSGVRAFLESAAASARLGIVSRANRSDVEMMLRWAGLESTFAVTVCGDDVLDPKPAPDGYHLALDRLRRLRPVAPGAALALEDSALGIKAARAAGARSIAVGLVPAHLAMEADAFIPSLEGQSLAALDQLSLPGQEHVS